MKKKTIKPILAIMLATTLVACGQQNKDVGEDNKSPKIEEQQKINETDNDKKIDKENKEESLEDRIEKRYAEIMKTPSEMTIDGVKSNVSLSKEDFVKNFELTKDESAEKAEGEEIYKTKKGNLVYMSATSVPFVALQEDGKEPVEKEEGRIAALSFSEGTEVELPRDISSKDTYEQANEKASVYMHPNAGMIPDALSIPTKDAVFTLYYEEGKLNSLILSEVDEYAVKQSLIIEEYQSSYEKEEDGQITLVGTEITFPIKIDELGKKIGGDFVDASKENTKEFYKDKNIYDFTLEGEKILKTQKGSILVDYFTSKYLDKDWADKEEIKESIDNVNFVHFKSDVPFELKNSELEISNKNLNELKTILDEKEIQYDEYEEDGNNVIQFYLDDNYIVKISGDYIKIIKSDKTNRDMYRASNKLYQDMQNDPYIQKIFGIDVNKDKIEEIDEEGDDKAKDSEGNKNTEEDKAEEDKIEEVKDNN